jgi:hypothetical protein
MNAPSKMAQPRSGNVIGAEQAFIIPARNLKQRSFSQKIELLLKFRQGKNSRATHSLPASPLFLTPPQASSEGRIN